MKNLDEHKKIAVLIDADNAQQSKIKIILDELAAHGHVVTKRAYGDWSSQQLKNWKTTINELAIQPVKQFAYTTGKNSIDSAMLIDAMDLLYAKKFDAFALVSSDSDFTKLASRLRESEMYVFGVGEKKTPIAFINACDDFIYTENLSDISINGTTESKIESVNVINTSTTVDLKNDSAEYSTKELSGILKRAWTQYKDDDRWVDIVAAGSFVKRMKPDFDPRSYGATKITDIIFSMVDIFDNKKFVRKGTTIAAYRPKKPA